MPAAASSVNGLLEEGTIITGLDTQYKIVKRLTHGSYGEVYEAVDLTTNERVAIKAEDASQDSEQLLPLESSVYEQLRDSIGVPRMRWCGLIADKHVNAIVIDLLGPNLEEIFQLCAKQLSLETIATLAVQMIDIVEFVHSRGVLVRDIKPDHFLFGIGDKSDKLFLIDFGLATRYLDHQGQHMRNTGSQRFVGTARYASINVHEHQQASRRDDMESLGYVLIYLSRGSLPCQKVQASTNKQRENRIGDMKIKTFDTLCEDLSAEFRDYLSHCRVLAFEEAPNYAYLRNLFALLAHAERRKRLAASGDAKLHALLVEDLKAVLKMPFCVDEVLKKCHAATLEWFRDCLTACEFDALLETLHGKAAEARAREEVAGMGGGFLTQVGNWTNCECWE